MDFRPLHDRVLVRRTEETETMVGSIIIPDSAKEKPQQGEVIAVGKGALLSGGDRGEMAVKPGDKVLFAKYSGSDTKVGSDEFLILHESELLAIVE